MILLALIQILIFDYFINNVRQKKKSIISLVPKCNPKELHGDS